MEVTMTDAPDTGTDNSFSKPQIVFVLGGPGAGKGTQCARLASDLHLVHISAGDLLRERKDQESPVIKRAIERAMALGDLVPPSVVMPILKKEIGKYAAVGKTKILLDGFPRDFPQAEAFMKEFGECSLVLYFKCSKETMLDRVRRRAGTSGRSDDNDTTFAKRLIGFWSDTMPLVPYFQGKLQDRFIEVDAEIPLDEGYNPLKETMMRRGF